ncbi:MAG: hypothetical protein IPG07_18020 [Crocinitomicaceae bacterium]|nr:hypothetical protein [Crocinitomicaceae bacterium]
MSRIKFDHINPKRNTQVVSEPISHFETAEKLKSIHIICSVQLQIVNM